MIFFEHPYNKLHFDDVLLSLSHTIIVILLDHIKDLVTITTLTFSNKLFYLKLANKGFVWIVLYCIVLLYLAYSQIITIEIICFTKAEIFTSIIQGKNELGTYPVVPPLRRKKPGFNSYWLSHIHSQTMNSCPTRGKNLQIRLAAHVCKLRVIGEINLL